MQLGEVGDIQKVWQELENWLDKNAPHLLKNLNLPATKEEIEQTEKELGIQFPQVVRDSYLIHNGSEDGLFFDTDFLSLTKVIREYNRSRLWYEDSPYSDVSFIDYEIEAHENIKKQIWNSKWIPLFSDSNMFLDLLDLDPSKKGAYGQIISLNEDICTVYFSAKSLSFFLRDILTELIAGKYAFYESGHLQRKYLP